MQVPDICQPLLTNVVKLFNKLSEAVVVFRTFLQLFWLLLLFQNIVVCTFGTITVFIIRINEKILALDSFVYQIDTTTCILVVLLVGIHKGNEPTFYLVNANSKDNPAFIKLHPKVRNAFANNSYFLTHSKLEIIR